MQVGECSSGFKIGLDWIKLDPVQGSITGEDVFNVLPFNNTVDRIEMTGAQLRSVLEDAVSELCPEQACTPTHFYQVRQGVLRVSSNQ